MRVAFIRASLPASLPDDRAAAGQPRLQAEVGMAKTLVALQVIFTQLPAQIDRDT
jgi:hypothetical protein